MTKVNKRAIDDVNRELKFMVRSNYYLTVNNEKSNLKFVSVWHVTYLMRLKAEFTLFSAQLQRNINKIISFTKM